MVIDFTLYAPIVGVLLGMFTFLSLFRLLNIDYGKEGDL
mgnify:CR=1 FL=1